MARNALEAACKELDRVSGTVPKKKEKPSGPTVESPTWGHVRRMAQVVLDKLGGPSGAANALSYESFYTLTILASLMENEKRDKAFIFGKQYLT